MDKLIQNKIAIGMILILIMTGFSTSTPLDERVGIINEIIERGIIENVPFVGQEKRFYCTLACQTMILNYYGLNFTRYKVFFLMGGGFSIHWHERTYLCPYPGAICSIRPSNYEFVGLLLNLTFQPFYADLSAPNENVWTKV